MRLRKKTWARPELDNCSYFITSPTDHIGKWNSVFRKPQPIHIELGCGKGGFISKLAAACPDINYIAIDIKDEILIFAKENIDNEYKEREIDTDNIKLMSQEIRLINKMLNELDVVDRIYINFPNPWYKGKHRSRRLTHPEQLLQYRSFLAQNGQIWFKTDHLDLFEDTIRYFERTGFKIIYQTVDLYKSDFKENIPTEHEIMYLNQGFTIKFLIAEKITLENEGDLTYEINVSKNTI